MLRLTVLLLLLANAAYFAWSQGLLSEWGLAPVQQSEPQRLLQQIKPEAIRILPSDEARRLEVSSAGAARPAECLQASLLTEVEAAGIKQVVDAWPAGSWSLEPAVEPARWIVYMGKYPDGATVERKKAELRYLGVAFEPLANATLEPGLSLGGYPSETAANQQFEALAQKGVRTARVVQERAEARGQSLRLPAVDEALRPRLENLVPALNGKPLRACR
ncbi:hypothetical protein GCM10027034_44010 [Ramlibacter solisilvae]|uniref:Signal peptide protein n=1 Tax=Ramlibacter tataouinensis TaxID=94132 RepID=A0A127JT74_9BURK|nr:hypothetical protein [Ramlibacter tataouinensis]AMO23144.1 signal peptide protein [Ramlibacter tataouinensis]